MVGSNTKNLELARYVPHLYSLYDNWSLGIQKNQEIEPSRNIRSMEKESSRGGTSDNKCKICRGSRSRSKNGETSPIRDPEEKASSSKRGFTPSDEDDLPGSDRPSD